MNTMTYHRNRFALAFLLALGLLAPLPAQTTVATPPAEPAEKTFMLETFSVNVEKDNGTVAVGKYADIIAVRGNPLRDIGVLRNVELVVKRGKRVK